eukprot:Skav236042  [mRNA]  locus=scaffold2302:2111:4019:+ [translate_table: standard]
MPAKTFGGSVWSTSRAFLAQLEDGEWVAGGYGASDVKTSLQKGVKGVWSTSYAFLAQLEDGEWVTWGDRFPSHANIRANIPCDVRTSLQKGVKGVWSTSYAFLAQLEDGEWVAWGDGDSERGDRFRFDRFGADISHVRTSLQKGVKGAVKVEEVLRWSSLQRAKVDASEAPLGRCMLDG